MDVQKLIAALAHDGRLTDDLAEALVDHLLQQPVATFLSAEVILNATLSAGTVDHLTRQLDQHGQTAVERIRARLLQADEELGDAVPQQVHEALVASMLSGQGPRLPWLLRSVDQPLLRELLTPVFQDFLLGFVSRIPAALGISSAGQMPSPTSAGSGGLLGRLGKEVSKGTGRKLVDMGRNVMGGLGLDLEERIQALAKDFSRGASDAFRGALERRLRSPDGQALLRQLSERGLATALKTPVAELAADLGRLPTNSVIGLMPPLVEHNLRHPLGRSIVQTELDAWFAKEGPRPLASLLEDLGLLATLRPELVSRVAQHARGFFASDAFATWLARWLDASSEA